MTPLDRSTLQAVFSEIVITDQRECQALYESLEPTLKQLLLQTFTACVCQNEGNPLRAFLSIFPWVYLKGVEAGKRIGLEEMMMGASLEKELKEKKPRARKKEFSLNGKREKESYEG